MSQHTTKGDTADMDSGASAAALSATNLDAICQVYPPCAAPYRFLGADPLIVGRHPGQGHLRVDDDRVSRRHMSIEPSPNGGWRARDMGSRNGMTINGVRANLLELSDGDVVRIGRTLFVFLEGELPAGCRLPRLGGGRGLARAIVELVGELAARSTLPLLIRGESGVGKERFARQLHETSGRSGAFVAINCGALSGELLASELFGHMRGAFSGAHARRTGLFASADRGTILLDEIGELPLSQQPALLRVLQEKRVRPVGSDREIEVDVRVIAATHRDMDAAVRSGRFRADLLARLRGITLRMPPLRRRRDEILPLFRRFVGELTFGASVAEALLLHDWPDNIRGLQHVAAHVRLFGEHVGRVHSSHLPAAFRRPPSRIPAESTPAESTPAEAAVGNRREMPTEAELRELLEAHRGNVSGVARALGVRRLQVYRWADRLEVSIDDYRGRSR